MGVFLLIDDLWEILFYVMLLMLGFFVEHKVLPSISDNPKKNNPFFNRLKIAQCIIFIRLLYVIGEILWKYF